MSEQKPIPVKVEGSKQIVYAIPAKPKPRPSFIERNADLLLLIWGCVILAVYIYFNP